MIHHPLPPLFPKTPRFSNFKAKFQYPKKILTRMPATSASRKEKPYLGLAKKAFFSFFFLVISNKPEFILTFFAIELSKVYLGLTFSQIIPSKVYFRWAFSQIIPSKVYLGLNLKLYLVRCISD